MNNLNVKIIPRKTTLYAILESWPTNTTEFEKL